MRDKKKFEEKWAKDPQEAVWEQLQDLRKRIDQAYAELLDLIATLHPDAAKLAQALLRLQETP